MNKLKKLSNVPTEEGIYTIIATVPGFIYKAYQYRYNFLPEIDEEYYVKVYFGKSINLRSRKSVWDSKLNSFPEHNRYFLRCKRWKCN